VVKLGLPRGQQVDDDASSVERDGLLDRVLDQLAEQALATDAFAAVDVGAVVDRYVRGSVRPPAKSRFRRAFGIADILTYDCAMRYRREIEVTAAPDATFAYLSDFANTAEWDPGIAEARRLTPPPTAVGSRFEIIALFRGRHQRFEYVVTELSDGSRIALRGDGEKACSDDVISVAASGSGTRVTYEADLRLKGLYRVAEPFLRSTFRRMGDDALDGLASRLSR
jgi:carbon monoxide dehydrogenase subunit G